MMKKKKMMIMKNNITLLSIITSQNYYTKTIRALHHCLNQIEFNTATIICPPECGQSTDKINHRFVDFTNQEYSQWILSNLHNCYNTDYCLTVQWDGFIINPYMWTDKFLQYDYIGAPWLNNWPNRVGNGGVSLRSKKFTEYMTTLKCGIGLVQSKEDFVSCVANYNVALNLGIKFAPVNLAGQFSVEYPYREKRYDPTDIETYNSFAFHGEFNTGAMNLLEKYDDNR